MFEDQGAVLGIIEGKNAVPGTDEIWQTAAYAVCPLAYSRWGRWRNKEPLVSLLISPQRLYRLTFTKSIKFPFGIELDIAMTNDKAQMEYELYQYVMKFIEDYHKAATGTFIDHESVNPLDWTPMNLKMEDLPPFPANAERWRTPLMSKNGFLFRTSSDAVKELIEKYFDSSGIAKYFNSSGILDLAPGTPVFVKYLSAVLDCNYEQSENSLTALLRYCTAKRRHLATLAALEADLAAAERRRVADLAAAERRRFADLAALGAKNRKRFATAVDRYHQLKKRFAAAFGFEPGAQDPDTSLSEAEDGCDRPPGDAAHEAQSHATPAATATAISYAEDVVHPYVAIFHLRRGHPMVVMHDAGDTLLDLVYRPDSAYRLEWQRSPRWRAAFLSQVGLSAINLVGEVALCHNDIRLPNIAVRDGRFCMIDFDFSSTSVLFQPRSAFSPPLKSLGMHWSPVALAMCYSVAQIAVNVFILSAPTQFSFADVTAAESLWSDVRDEASPVDSEFQAWVDGRGGPLPSFVAAVRAACGTTEEVPLFPADLKGYFADVLRRMLVE